MSQSNHPNLSFLKNCNLVGITFIHDYLQLLLEGPKLNPKLNGYVWPQIKTEGGLFSLESVGYRDILCGQIGKKVSDAAVSDEEIVLIFSDKSEIHFSFREEDLSGPEAVMLCANDHTWVW
jgi:hypothetical protein